LANHIMCTKWNIWSRPFLDGNLNKRDLKVQNSKSWNYLWLFKSLFCKMLVFMSYLWINTEMINFVLFIFVVVDLISQIAKGPGWLIWRGFSAGFVHYKKGVLDLQPQVIKFTSCLPMVGGSLRVLRLLPPLKLVAMI